MTDLQRTKSNDYVSAWLNDSREFGPVPFWFWNGEMKESEIKRQLEEMLKKGVTEVIIHPREGLLIPYPSCEWFDKVSYAVEHAALLDMIVWLYDDYNCPSGFVNTQLLKKFPQYRAKHLYCEKRKIAAEDGLLDFRLPAGELVKVLVTQSDGMFKLEECIDVTEHVVNSALFWRTQPGTWTIYIFMQRLTNVPAFYSYDHYGIDVMDEQAVSAFIEMTHEEYAKRVGQYFGTTIRGFFTDEPGMYNNSTSDCWGNRVDLNTVPWTPHFLEKFEAKKGYSLATKLPYLWKGTSDEALTVRRDYYDVVATFFTKAYFNSIRQWCSGHNLLLTGHLLAEEDIANASRCAGSVLRTLGVLNVPGVDAVGSFEHRCFVPKLAASAGLHNNNLRIMDEVFGGAGWELQKEQVYSHTADFFVMGINMIVPHAFFYSIEGRRYNECPPSFFFQSPWWDEYGDYAEFVRRASRILGTGRPVAKVLVYYPEDAAWAKLLPNDTGEVDVIAEKMARLSSVLLENQLDYYFVGIDHLPDLSVADSGEITTSLGDAYDALVVHESIQHSRAALHEAERIARLGGAVVVVIGEIDSLSDTKWSSLFKCSDIRNISSVLKQNLEPHVKVVSATEPNKVGYTLRRSGDSLAYFFMNYSEDQDVVVELHGYGEVVCGNPYTGELTSVDATEVDGRHLQVRLSLGSFESRFVFMAV